MSKRKAAKRTGKTPGAGSLTGRPTTPRNILPAEGSAQGGIGKSDIRKIQALLQSKTPGGVTAGLSLLQSLKVAESDWKAVFTPSVIKALAESWDICTWQAAAEGLGRLSALRSSFESAIVLQFARLSKQRQREVLEGSIEELRPQLVIVFKKLVAIVNEHSHRDDDPLFSQLQRLPDSAAEVLASYCRVLSFPRLKALSDNAAAWLGKCENGYGLHLDAVASLSDKAAAGLARFQGNSLSLAGLASLTDASAKALGGFAGALELRLSGLRSISDNAVSRLARYKGQKLDLCGLKNISDAAAGHFATYTGDELDLSGLQGLSDAAAARLARFKGQELDLSGLRSLSDQAIGALAKGKMWCVRLDGLRAVSENAAGILERRDPNAPHVSLDGLSGRMSSVTAEALIRGGYSLTPADGVSSPSIEIVFKGPVEIEMTRATSSRDRGRVHAGEAKSSDFWRISLEGNSYTVTEGRTCTAGRSVKKSFDGPKAALKSFAKAIWSREREGFDVVKQKA